MRPSADWLSNNVFSMFSSKSVTFWKKSLNGRTTVVGVHATVGRLSNNVHTRFKQFGIFLKKVTERSRDSGRSSRNLRPTVKQRFWTFQTFWKKLLNGHATEVRDHATVDQLFSISLFAFATVVLPDGTNVVSVVLLSFQRYKVINIRNF